ncbi:ABC transporter ATP-binding protein [Actinomycetospora endophytica]|uniref:ABC transporter ATP-binding protein n=1 Tax=Actinomycetospora endophytica TaxID=2291215 RepID=A0ABS8PHI4_9PSEU|nr:ABC transporter ATP-binding protein [Actinomycetospora endophytica]MCD2197736.1 ABC transporter ATP-binding protein [Actinomycetospora endophytica]
MSANREAQDSRPTTAEDPLPAQRRRARQALALPGPAAIEAPLVIETHGLTKRYGSRTAVDDVDLHVAQGDRYGFLGPNGSGKTTLVRMLLGLVYATRGEIRVLGREVPSQVHEVLPSIGAMVEGPAAYGHLSGRANLDLLDASGPGGRSGRKRRVEEALERVGLARIDRRPVRTYSLGMRQRLGLAGALLTTPDLLVLDEPTNGLDPHGIREIRELLIELNEEGTTVFLSSHLLAEIEALCTRVGVVDHGKLVLEEPMDSVRRTTGRIIVVTPDVDRALGVLGRAVVDRTESGGIVVAPPDGDGSHGLARHLIAHEVRLDALEPERVSLEDVVVDLTGPGDDRAAGSDGTGRNPW